MRKSGIIEEELYESSASGSAKVNNLFLSTGKLTGTLDSSRNRSKQDFLNITDLILAENENTPKIMYSHSKVLDFNENRGSKSKVSSAELKHRASEETA